jgi:hypothetical protein
MRVRFGAEEEGPDSDLAQSRAAWDCICRKAVYFIKRKRRGKKTAGKDLPFFSVAIMLRIDRAKEDNHSPLENCR